MGQNCSQPSSGVPGLLGVLLVLRAASAYGDGRAGCISYRKRSACAQHTRSPHASAQARGAGAAAVLQLVWQGSMPTQAWACHHCSSSPPCCFQALCEAQQDPAV
jgi:hypothetical protein